MMYKQYHVKITAGKVEHMTLWLVTILMLHPWLKMAFLKFHEDRHLTDPLSVDQMKIWPIRRNRLSLLMGAITQTIKNIKIC